MLGDYSYSQGITVTVCYQWMKIGSQVSCETFIHVVSFVSCFKRGLSLILHSSSRPSLVLRLLGMRKTIVATYGCFIKPGCVTLVCYLGVKGGNRCKSETADLGWANTTVVTNSNTGPSSRFDSSWLNTAKCLSGCLPVHLSACLLVCLSVSLPSAVCSMRSILSHLSYILETHADAALICRESESTGRSICCCANNKSNSGSRNTAGKWKWRSA